MKEILESELAIIADRYIELDNMLIISNKDESYMLEYEYLRGKRDILIHLLSICEEDDEWDDDYPIDIINEF